MKKLFLLILFPFILTYSQISIDTGKAVTQNFNSLGTSATATLPSNWKVDKNTSIRFVGTYSGAGTTTNQIGGISLSSSATNGIYNFGLGDPASATDRAIGGLSSSSASKSVNVYAYFQNTGQSTIKRVDISYDVLRFRNGLNSSGFTIQLYYSLDGSTWTSAGTNFTSSFSANLDNSGGTTVPIETKNVINQTISGLTLAPGGNFYLAWNYSVTSGATTSNAQALGIDNFVMNNILAGDLAPIPSAPVANNALKVSATGFTANWNATEGALGYYFDLSTSSLFDSFVDGFDNKNVGNVTSSTISNLNPSTTYYYRVRAFNISGVSDNSNTITTVTPEIITKVQFNKIASAAPKSDGKFNLVLKISNPAPRSSTECTVTYFADSSSASASYINNFSSQVVTFPAGSSDSQFVMINLNNNGISERSKKAYFRITSVSGGLNAVVGTQPNFYLTIMSGIDSSYYSSISSTLKGDDLKTALHNLIKNQIKYPYTDSGTDIWDILSDTDEDSNDPSKIIGIYSGISELKSNHDMWNREHVWSKSHGNFGTDIGPGTDAHHLRAEVASVNTLKNNLDFDNGGNPIAIAPGCFYDLDSWEPRDAVKGDVARMIFYMATRYQGDAGEPTLTVVDYIPSSPSNQPLYGKLSTLLKWNLQDPPDAYEINRNNNIYYYQHNRNPFIDHYEWVTSIWGSPVGLSDKNNNILPNEYKLLQNYPNPFNPSTNINYYLPAASYVSLSIYNTLGQKVAVLFEGTQSAGYHFAKWNAGNFASGIYFLTIDAVSNGNQPFHAVKKMMLLK